MRRKQFEPLVVSDFEEEVYHLPMHSHTYYELIYIHSGRGTHLLNGLPIAYSSGDLFAVSPADEHRFIINEKTHFTFIQFTDSYFRGVHTDSEDSLFLFDPVTIMTNKLIKEKKLEINAPCTTMLKNMIQNILDYNCKKDIGTSAIVYYHVFSILALIREALLKLNITLKASDADKDSLISYIHQHIYDPTKIQVANIAAHFNIAANYFSAYFKRKFEVSYRDYVRLYKLKLIEKRIESGKYSLKQIANEFGFNDESHLSHFFKNIRHMSPMSYGKQKKSSEKSQV